MTVSLVHPVIDPHSSSPCTRLAELHGSTTTDQPYSGYSHTTVYSCPQNAKAGDISKFVSSLCALIRHVLAVQMKENSLGPGVKIYAYWPFKIAGINCLAHFQTNKT